MQHVVRQSPIQSRHVDKIKDAKGANDRWIQGDRKNQNMTSLWPVVSCQKMPKAAPLYVCVCIYIYKICIEREREIPFSFPTGLVLLFCVKRPSHFTLTHNCVNIKICGGSQTHHNMLFFHACCGLAIALNLESQKPLCNLLVACARSKSEIY